MTNEERRKKQIEIMKLMAKEGLTAIEAARKAGIEVPEIGLEKEKNEKSDNHVC